MQMLGAVVYVITRYEFLVREVSSPRYTSCPWVSVCRLHVYSMYVSIENFDSLSRE